MRKRLLLFSCMILMLCQTALFAQTTVTGVVTGANQAPLAGVTVMVNGTTIATTTDEEGKFSINAPSNATLVFNYVGYGTQRVAVNGQSTVTVSLAQKNNDLDEVVVTGYTSQRKKDIVGSVSVVDMKAVKQLPSGSVLSALQGQAAGLNIINNGSPGAGSTIFIRGINSFGNVTPLVLVDGVQSSINEVPANDVESIQVLKDAGAASVYGTRGSNGVIIITTRKGKSGAPKISLESYGSLQIPRKNNPMNLLDAQGFAKIYNEINPGNTVLPNGVIPDYGYRGPGVGNSNAGYASEGDPEVDPSLYNFDPQNWQNNYIISKFVKTGMTDMYDEVTNPAWLLNNTLSVSGGSDKGNYLLSIGYLNHQGTLENTYLKRYNVRLNSMYKIGKHIRIGENINLAQKSNPATVGFGSAPFGSFGPISVALNQLPFLPTKDIGGNYSGTFIGNGNFELGDWGNAAADRYYTDNNRQKSYQILGNLYIEVDFAKHFTAKSSIGGFVQTYNSQMFAYNQYWTSNGGGNLNSLVQNAGSDTRLQWTNTLNYNNQIGKHSINVIGGTESLENNGQSQEATGQKFFLTDFNFLTMNNAQVRLPPTSYSYKNTLFSLFAKADYVYDSKYILSATIRRDGYSMFGSNSKYGNFPALALGWVMSEENFMKGINWLNFLKLKGSYGVMGFKENLGANNAYNTYALDPGRSYYDIAGVGSAIQLGFYPQQNGNSLTSWEKNKVLNIGAEATFFNSLDVQVEWFQKNIDGLLFAKATPATAGEASPPSINLGDVQNKGLDVTVNYRGRINKDLAFNAGLTWSRYRNKIIDFPDPGVVIDGEPIRHAEGYAMSQFFGYEVIDVFNDQKAVDDAALQQDAAPGRYQYRDVDGNDTINVNDRVFFGNPNPDFIMGLNLGVTWKNFDFSAQIYGSYGNDIYNGSNEWLGSWERGMSNKFASTLNAWTPENPTSNIKKNENIRNFSNTGVTNSSWMEDGSYTKLRSVMIGYSLSPNVISKLGISRLRFYVQGNNLVILTNYSGLDPEIPSGAGGTGGYRGVDGGGYVPERGVTFGLNVSF